MVILATVLPAEQGLHTFHFDATGDWIAVAVPKGVLILPTSPSVGDGRRLPLPPELEPAHLIWSESGRTLAITALPASPDGAWLAVLLDDDPLAVHLVATANGETARVQLRASQDADALVVSEAVCGPAPLRGEGGPSWR